MEMIKKNKNVFVAVLIALITAAVLFGAYCFGKTEPSYVSYADFIASARRGEVAEVNLSDGDKISFTYEKGGALFNTDNPRRENFKEQLLLKNITVNEGGVSASGDMLIQIGFFTAVAAGGLYLLKNRGGKSKFAEHASSVGSSAVGGAEAKRFGFRDIAGNAEAKESVADVVDFLREPEKYARYGARMPRGILLHGRPGTGKTLMARAMAGEAGVPFYAVGGSDFVQMYVGVGAARVRELFKKAREAGRAVIFIDEIDALGKKRSDGTAGGNDEREQTLNALLAEMSGFSKEEGIVVVAATNRPDILDEALLRPGRFDRKIEIALPDMNARRQILELHAKNKPVSKAYSLDKLARDTVFFSGAMLESLLNDAAIFAARRGGADISSDDVSRAYYTTLVGYEKKDRSADLKRELQITAWHESGHALAASLLSPENKISRVSIIPSSSGAGGFCVNIPPERMYVTKKDLERQIMINLAGRAAEELRFGSDNVTTGASNDIEKATSTAAQYITRFGMSKTMGLVNRSGLQSDAEALKECASLVTLLYEDVKALLGEHRKTLDALSVELLEKETLDGEDIERIRKAG